MQGEPKPSSLLPPIEPGTVVAGKFRVDRVIASGGMGIILVAQHLLLRQRVAIKMLRAHALEDPDIVTRFAREARAAARIRSEHVVRVIDVGDLPNGTPYMVMEYLSGSDLSQVLKTNGPLSVEDAVEYLLQACVALAEAHHAGIVHRDLKPANLFLTRRTDGTPLVKVLDFGISKLREQAFNLAENADSITSTSAMMGSLNYMSPEQLRSARDVDLRTDIWALGATLYKLLTQKSAFVAESSPELCVEILHGEPRSLGSVRPDLPPGLGDVINRCLRKKPEDRYANVGEFADAIREFAPPRSRESIERVIGIVKSAARVDSYHPPPLDAETRESSGDASEDKTRTAPSSLEIPIEVGTMSTLGASVSASPAGAISKTADSTTIPKQKISWLWVAASVVALGGSALFLLSSKAAPPNSAAAISTSAPSVTSEPLASALASATPSAIPAPSTAASADVTSASSATVRSTPTARTHAHHAGAPTAAAPTATVSAPVVATSVAPGEKPDFGGRK